MDAIAAGRYIIRPIEIQTRDRYGIVVNVTGPDGRNSRRPRRFYGETAHMDADRYMNDLLTQLDR